jgi:hypothetical protein
LAWESAKLAGFVVYPRCDSFWIFLLFQEMTEGNEQYLEKKKGKSKAIHISHSVRTNSFAVSLPSCLALISIFFLLFLFFFPFSTHDRKNDYEGRPMNYNRADFPTSYPNRKDHAGKRNEK